MAALTFEPYVPPPRCDAWRAKSGKLRCELPPNHAFGDLHIGRDRAGRVHQWYGDARDLSRVEENAEV